MSLTDVVRRRCAGAGLGLPALLVCLLSLSGCASHPGSGVQVVDGGRAGSAHRQPVTSGSYTVRRGDTLYMIASRFGWDWRQLAAHNGIPAPYVIHPGQKIQFGAVTATASARAARPAARAESNPAETVVPQSVPANVARDPHSTAAAKAPESAPVVTSAGSAVRSASGWTWPTNGTLIGLFSSNGSLNKGIDIAGELGQPVLAASDGTVVYAGSGLRGYGELIIIKHSDTYVSAYGHNRRLLVREGQQVKAGQAIAEMGSTGTDRVKLHFEIRRQGKPVDPLQYLPRR